MNRENYDPSKPVCDNQDDFNVAVREAIKYNNKQDMKKVQGVLGVWLALYVIFFVWAVILALKVQNPEHRIVHLVFAMIASPIYVLAYYLRNISA